MGQLHLPAHTRASFADLDSTGEFRMVEFVKIQRKNCFREKCLREGSQSVSAGGFICSSIFAQITHLAMAQTTQILHLIRQQVLQVHLTHCLLHC